MPESPCCQRVSGRWPEWAFSGGGKYRFNPISISGSLSDVRFLRSTEKSLELVLNRSWRSTHCKIWISMRGGVGGKSETREIGVNNFCDFEVSPICVSSQTGKIGGNADLPQISLKARAPRNSLIINAEVISHNNFPTTRPEKRISPLISRHRTRVTGLQ